MKRMGRWLAAAVALVVFCSGCSLDAESFLKPPRSQGEQQKVQQALETYIRDSGVSERYTLKYPSEGEYLSAFVLCDGQGRPVETDGDTAQMAIAFYARSSASEETHINLLRRDGEEWVSVADALGSGLNIRQVAFGDLDGNGIAELITGWSTYNSRENRLAVYDMQNGLTLLSDDRLYTALYVGDLMADGGDSLLLLHSRGNSQVTATLERLTAGALSTVDTVSLDGEISRFGTMTLCRLAQGVHGLYVEGIRSDNVWVTELVYYDKDGLAAPFYETAANISAVTHRSNGLTARDVDGDGQVEIPYSYPLREQSVATDLTGYITQWRAWDYDTRSWTEHLNTVVNTVDNYLIVLDEGQRQGLTTAYDTKSHTLDLLDADTGKIWLRLCPNMCEAPAETMKQLTLLQGDEESGFVAWYDPQTVDSEKVRYMVFRLTEGE